MEFLKRHRPQTPYVTSHVKSVLINRKRPRSSLRGDARNHTREYDFEVNGKVIRVCKTFSLNTLSISQTFVTTSLIKKKSGGIVSTDDRGRHDHHARVPDFVRESVREHIGQFPVEESHYSREKSKRKYLGSRLNLSKMYNLYRSQYDTKNLLESAIAKEWLYADIFNSEYICHLSQRITIHAILVTLS